MNCENCGKRTNVMLVMLPGNWRLCSPCWRMGARQPNLEDGETLDALTAEIRSADGNQGNIPRGIPPTR